MKIKTFVISIIFLGAGFNLNAQYRWTKLALGEMGVGASYGQKIGFPLYIDGIDFAMGFSQLGGLGLGTKLLEFNANLSGPDLVAVTWLPIYLYFPLKFSEPKKAYQLNQNIVPWFITLYGGGSFWAIDLESESYTRYGNFGIMAVRSFEAPAGMYGRVAGTFSFKTGLRYGHTNYGHNRMEVYGSVGFGAYSFVRKKSLVGQQ